MAASHMKHIHASDEDGEMCPLCPKSFKKIDFLKNHVWRHVNRAYPGEISAMFRGKIIQEILGGARVLQ